MSGEREVWRVGEHYGIHVYAGDRPVATFHRPEDAAQAVVDHADAIAPGDVRDYRRSYSEQVDRAEAAEAEVERLRGALAEAWDAGAQAATDWIQSGAWLATMPENPHHSALAEPTPGSGSP